MYVFLRVCGLFVARKDRNPRKLYGGSRTYHRAVYCQTHLSLLLHPSSLFPLSSSSSARVWVTSQVPEGSPSFSYVRKTVREKPSRYLMPTQQTPGKLTDFIRRVGSVHSLQASPATQLVLSMLGIREKPPQTRSFSSLKNRLVNRWDCFCTAILFSFPAPHGDYGAPARPSHYDAG